MRHIGINKKNYYNLYYSKTSIIWGNGGEESHGKMIITVNGDFY
jgi:hypothetical protein